MAGCTRSVLDVPLLVILRHAKSAWPDGVADHDRPLAPRGQRDAPAAGQWIYARVGVPQRIVCSTAKRTRQTLELAGNNWPEEFVVEYSDRVYAASAEDLISVAATASADCEVQLLVSHNPGCADAVLALGGRTGALAAAVEQKFPTSAVAVLEIPDWSQLRPGCGSLIDFAVPRG
jgi:phosphohistidine phosphatase